MRAWLLSAQNVVSPSRLMPTFGTDEFSHVSVRIKMQQFLVFRLVVKSSFR